MDIIGSLGGLILLSSILIITGILTKIKQRAYYICSKKVGLNGKEFKMYKFRLMVVNAEKLKDKLTKGSRKF